MDKMLSKLSAEERENMLKDIAELDSGKGLSARWRHYHTALSVITFVLIIAMLSCIGFFIPLIVLGVIGNNEERGLQIDFEIYLYPLSKC